MKEEYTHINGWGSTLEPCPFCGHPAELWEHTVNGDQYQKVAMCSNPGDEDTADGCPMIMPPEGFYKATKREAINVWNARK